MTCQFFQTYKTFISQAQPSKIDQIVAIYNSYRSKLSLIFQLNGKHQLKIQIQIFI